MPERVYGLNELSLYKALAEDAPEDIEMRVIDGLDVRQHARAAFDFLRRHDSGRYSARSKLEVLELEANGSGLIRIVQVPFSFDEETETKRGGVLGVAVTLGNPSSGRLLIAVNEDYRRRGVGTNLAMMTPAAASWVHRTNQVGQMFLLSQGWMPASMSCSGAIQFTRSIEQANGDTPPGGVDPDWSPRAGGYNPGPHPMYDDDGAYIGPDDF